MRCRILSVLTGLKRTPLAARLPYTRKAACNKTQGALETGARQASRSRYEILAQPTTLFVPPVMGAGDPLAARKALPRKAWVAMHTQTSTPCRCCRSCWEWLFRTLERSWPRPHCCFLAQVWCTPHKLCPDSASRSFGQK